MRKTAHVVVLLTGIAAATLASAQVTLAQVNPAPASPPGTTGNPAANQPATPGAVSPANPNAASRPQVPNISGSPVVVQNTTGCGTGSASGRPGC